MKTKTKKLELSVVIPVLNEEQNIKELAYEIDKALKNFSHEIIFVDDAVSYTHLTLPTKA